RARKSSPKPRTLPVFRPNCRNTNWLRRWGRMPLLWCPRAEAMSDIVSNPLLALVKERNLIDDLQLEEVLQEQARSGKTIRQILQDFELVDLDTQLQVMAEHLSTEVVNLSNLD